MQTRDPREKRSRQDRRRHEMRPAGEVLERLLSRDDHGGRWLWRDRWVEA